MADAEDNTVIRTFKYRLLPSKRQHEALARILEDQRILYNAAKQEREDCYQKTGKALSYPSQCKELTRCREQIAEMATTPLNIQRWTIKRLDEAFRAFFRRVKSGKEPGFPRFKSKRRWRSFGFSEFRNSIALLDGRIRFKGLPSSLRIHMHKSPPQGKVLSCVFTRDAKGWSVSLQMRIAAQRLCITGRQIGVDLGLKELAALSTGEAIPNVRIARRSEREMRLKQRALARCKRGSIRRRKIKLAVTRCHTRIKNTRNTYLHQVSARLVRDNDLIAMENLNVKAMGAGMFAKSIHDASWSKLKQMIAYKAESAGRQFIEVDPRNTTQACSRCGVIVPKKLSERWHCCPHCGLEMDRDKNAAINILREGVLALGQLNAAECRKRVAGNLNRRNSE